MEPGPLAPATPAVPYLLLTLFCLIPEGRSPYPLRRPGLAVISPRFGLRARNRGRWASDRRADGEALALTILLLGTGVATGGGVLIAEGQFGDMLHGDQDVVNPRQTHPGFLAVQEVNLVRMGDRVLALEEVAVVNEASAGLDLRMFSIRLQTPEREWTLRYGPDASHEAYSVRVDHDSHPAFSTRRPIITPGDVVTITFDLEAMGLEVAGGERIIQTQVPGTEHPVRDILQVPNVL